MDKREVAAALEEIATLLELTGGNMFQLRAYTNAARLIESLDQDLGTLVSSGGLGDLKGIGARSDGPRLQALIAFGTIGGGRGRGETAGVSRTARRATVTLASGETFSGILVRLTDFDVTIRDGRVSSEHANSEDVLIVDPRGWVRLPTQASQTFRAC